MNPFFCRKRNGEASGDMNNFLYCVLHVYFRCEFDMIDMSDNINGVLFCFVELRTWWKSAAE